MSVWLRRIPHKLRRIAVLSTYTPAYCYRQRSVVCLSVCWSVSQSH